MSNAFTDLMIARKIEKVKAELAAQNAAAFAPIASMPKNLVKAGADKVLYQPSSLSLIRWRALRGEVLAGKKSGHIAVLGDSVAYGAASTGASNPKPVNSWPGQLRTQLNQRYGGAGSGVVLANKDTRANPAWDSRFTFAGGLLDHTFGLHSYSAYRLNGGTDAALDFTDTADEFWVYTLSGSAGTFTMQVDAQTAQTGSHVSGAGGAFGGGTVARESGFYYNGTTNSHNVFKLPTGSTGVHTLKIRPSATTGQNTFVTAVEARVNGAGRFRVSNASISGKSLATFVDLTANYGDSTGVNGFPMLDDLKANLLVLSLGVNDWQSQRSLADTKTRLNNIITRQRSNSTTGGIVPSNGDVVLLWNPKPDTVTLGSGSYTNPSWDAYRDLHYQVADENDVALIDLGGRWKDFTTANGYGLFADTIHPSDKGAGDIAGSVYRALFTEA